ncbi:MarR family transcriptional regulator [Bacillus cytotoxicus]|uniref:MarR family transcriptional regulator n=1 Tax=Bacillus cytotoxicus TaxID=580165 RepID=A0ACC6A5P9_9BACI|nr:MarR family transcriptional regulator [Bacillus cytotoxicus]HDX9580451.1 MarR family transcriptional regulator [Bacillus pseudomycoides]
MRTEGGCYMDSREWERIVDHLLSLVPLFYRKFMLPGEFSSQRHMPPSHAQVLLLLHERDTLAVSEIGKRLAISRPNMTPLLNKLIQEELVERHYSEKDRRVILMSLTAEGKSLVNQYKQFLLKKLKENLQTLSASDREQLTHSLQTIQNLILKANI